MKLKYIKIITIFILVLSILIFVQNCFMFLVAGFGRKHDAVFIDDNNRNNIITLLEENTENFEEIPDIQRAVKIEYLALIHKDEVTIHYEDETTFIFNIKDTLKVIFNKHKSTQFS